MRGLFEVDKYGVFNKYLQKKWRLGGKIQSNWLRKRHIIIYLTFPGVILKLYFLQRWFKSVQTPAESSKDGALTVRGIILRETPWTGAWMALHALGGMFKFIPVLCTCQWNMFNLNCAVILRFSIQDVPQWLPNQLQESLNHTSQSDAGCFLL